MSLKDTHTIKNKKKISELSYLSNVLFKLFLKFQIRTASSHIAVPKTAYHFSFFSSNLDSGVPLYLPLLPKPFFSYIFCWILFCLLFLAFTSKVGGISVNFAITKATCTTSSCMAEVYSATCSAES